MKFRNSFLIWLGVAFVIFIIGATTTPARGTREHFMYWPIIIWFIGGLLYFFAIGIKGLIAKRKKG